MDCALDGSGFGSGFGYDDGTGNCNIGLDIYVDGEGHADGTGSSDARGRCCGPGYRSDGRDGYESGDGFGCGPVNGSLGNGRGFRSGNGDGECSEYGCGEATAGENTPFKIKIPRYI